MKLLTPCSRGRSVWAYTSSFGGGLLAGDVTRLDVRLGPSACCFVGTQACTKVYRNPDNRPCAHVTRAQVASEAMLVFVPDAVQPFAGSTYTQRQEFHLEPRASLALLDWHTSGRMARGERWAFNRYSSRNDVFLGGKRVFVDSMRLDASDGAHWAGHRVGRFHCFAMLLLSGERVREIASRLLKTVSARPIKARGAVLCGASPVGDGAVLRVAGEDMESVTRELRPLMASLGELLGDDPWSRRW
ncbi:MAG TPA: urease accessory protein UreD [Verrucomicrobiota bacterium]|nr:urease accessory protein UreD [Verrucomicrobiota bacterium]